MRIATRGGRFLGAALLLGGCYIRTPPPRAPSFAPPPAGLAAAPSRPGTGRVIVDVDDLTARPLTARVYHLVPTYAEERWTPAQPGDEHYSVDGIRYFARTPCATPCSLDLPTGRSQSLLIVRRNFRDADMVSVVPRESTTLLRHTMGAPPYRHETMFSGGLALLVGSLVVNGSVAATLLSWPWSDSGSGSADRQPAQVLWGVSLALIPVGLVLMLVAPRTSQPGASSLWSLDGTPLPR